MCRVVQVSLCRVGMMGGCLVVTTFMVPGGFAMMPGGMLVVFGCFMVMLRCLLGHLTSFE